MIKVANNLQRMLAKQAAANPLFDNYSSDPLRPALAAKGQLPQSYIDEEAITRDLGDKSDFSFKDTFSSKMTPQQYAMLMNSAIGSQNASGDPRGPERIYTHGAYGPSRVYQDGISQFSPYGYGDLYNMSPSQIQRNPRTNMLM